MTALEWAAPGTKFFEAGLDRGVIYVAGQAPEVWNGLVRIGQVPSGAESTAYYQEGRKYLEVRADEEFGGSIEAFTYPDSFDLCNGVRTNQYGITISQQNRLPFGMSYRTGIGNDLEGLEHGHKIHLVYNAMVSPSSMNYETVGSSTSPLAMSWDFNTTPIDAGLGFMPTAHVVLDSRKINKDILNLIERYLYGSEGIEPRLLTIAELNEQILQGFTLQVIDNGDGTWTATGTEGELTFLTSSMFRATGPTVTNIDPRTFQLRSITDLEV